MNDTIIPIKKDTLKTNIDSNLVKINDDLSNEKNEIYENIINNKRICEIKEENPENYLETIRECMLYAINKYRKENGLNELKIDESLNTSALNFAKYLITNNLTGHAGLGYGEYERQKRIKNQTKNKYIMPTGENNAYWVEKTTISNIMNEWIGSEYHKSTLDCDSKYLGIGYSFDPKTGRSVLVMQAGL